MVKDNPIVYHGLDHVVLNVTDIARSLAFYREVLGMKLERIIEDAGIYQVRCGRHIIDLQTMPAGASLAPVELRGVDHVCVLVQGDFGRIVAYLREQAVPIVFGPTELYGATGFGTSIYVLDPDGHRLEIKADHAEYPLRTTVAAAKAQATRPHE